MERKLNSPSLIEVLELVDLLHIDSTKVLFLLFWFNVSKIWEDFEKFTLMYEEIFTFISAFIMSRPPLHFTMYWSRLIYKIVNHVILDKLSFVKIALLRDHSYITSALVGGEGGSENANFCWFLVQQYLELGNQVSPENVA